MALTDPSAMARALYDARRDRAPIPPFTDSDPSLTMSDGYAIQQELVRLLLADGDQVIGHKVGATSEAMQRLIGLDSPDYGPVLGSTLHHDGDTLALDRFIAPKIEAEIGFVLGDRLRGPGVTVDDARSAIAGAVAAMEIVDSRIADWRIRLADTVADLASNGAVALSCQVVPLAGIDPRDIAMTLSRDGEVIDSGKGAAALGDPVAVLAWLANTLGEAGVCLEPGHLILTGALHAAVPLAPGDTFRADFGPLGAVTLHVADIDRTAEDRR
ncbi:2-keto-4-pentenoate hydratase [Streptomyces sp. NPDC098781]|uniref:2-keto-4-pentenoate hydratase n=1 Tax=Streptomyces sp. NPDC098781 TaxID=3366097 RepID=UPI0037FD1E38